MDDARLAQEIAFLADRLDITEELVRFRAHLAAAREALGRSDSPSGKQLGFLAQELGREVNTMGSKANDAEIAHEVDRHEGRAREIPGTAREPRVKPFLLVLSSPSGGGKTHASRGNLLQGAGRPGLLGLGHDPADRARASATAWTTTSSTREEFLRRRGGR